MCKHSPGLYLCTLTLLTCYHLWTSPKPFPVKLLLCEWAGSVVPHLSSWENPGMSAFMVSDARVVWWTCEGGLLLHSVSHPARRPELHAAPITLKGRGWRARCKILSHQRSLLWLLSPAFHRANPLVSSHPAEAFIIGGIWVVSCCHLSVQSLPLCDRPARHRTCRQGCMCRCIALLLPRARCRQWSFFWLVFHISFLQGDAVIPIKWQAVKYYHVHAIDRRKGKGKGSRLHLLVCTPWNNLILKNFARLFMTPQSL